MRPIQTPYALSAMRGLADYIPAAFLELEQNPQEFLEYVEEKVTKATNWKQTAMSNGAWEDGATEIMWDMLLPSYQPEDPEEIEITEIQIQEAYQKLLVAAGVDIEDLDE